MPCQTSPWSDMGAPHDSRDWWTERVFRARALVGHDVAGFAECLGGVGPAALLGATDGDFGLRDFFDQDRGVEDAVLFGAGEFLAVNEQDGFVGAVNDHEVGDRAGGGDFGDGDVPGGEGFAEGAVLECAVCRGDEGQDGDVFVGLRFPEFERIRGGF